MPATIYPGRANLLMDHLQLGLRRHGAATGTDPHFYLSLYAIPWSREMGAGHVALVRQQPADGPPVDVTLTDNPSLGRALQAQLRSVGYSRVDLTGEPRAAAFTRSPIKDQDHVRYQIASVGLEIEARWDGLGEAIFAYGPAPQQPERQEIWSMLFEADQAYVAVDGLPVHGQTYAMEHWIPWLGRSLNSAHIARNEILVDRPDDEPDRGPNRNEVG